MEDTLIKIKEGYVGGTCFSIMPVRIKDTNKNTNDSDNVEECKELEIAIEEDDVRAYLYYILLEIFNDSLDANIIRHIEEGSFYKVDITSTFEWNRTYNFFDFEDIERLIDRIKHLSNLIENDYNNFELFKYKVNYAELAFSLPEYDFSKDYSVEEVDELVEKNKNYIIDFYNRFIGYMEKMIKEGKEKGYTLISFMGP